MNWIEDWEREHLKDKIYIEEEKRLIMQEIAEEELLPKMLGSSREIRKFAINEHYATRKRPRFLKYVARKSPILQSVIRTS